MNQKQECNIKTKRNNSTKIKYKKNKIYQNITNYPKLNLEGLKVDVDELLVVEEVFCC